MTAEKNFLRQLADNDIDDLMDQARKLPRGEREQSLREMLELLAGLRDPVARVKALSWIQASLAGFDADDFALPVPLAIDLVAKLTQTVRSKSEPAEARQSALTGIALVFTKVNELPSSLDAAVRRAFRSAASDSDEELRDYAKSGLGGHGVLSRRRPMERSATPGPVHVTINQGGVASLSLIEGLKNIAGTGKRTRRG